MSSKPLLIVIAGPTASGKTNTAIQIANHFNTEIISADSRQVYHEMTIGTAKPTADELLQAKHHFVNHISIHQKYDVGMYRNEVLQLMQTLFQKNKVLVMCGGTGLYVRAVCEGIDEFPEIDASVKQLIHDNYQQFGIEWLQNTLKVKDENYFNIVDIKNPYRLIRALEVCLQTNMPYSSFRNEDKKVEQFFDVLKIGLQMPREFLYQRINDRVELMIQNGLEQEVRNLYEYKHLQALQTVGYAEWIDYFENINSKETTIELIKQNTRHYAKRQITWFKKEKNLTWMDAKNLDEMIVHINSTINH
jgi:tRNA dimethylallyltransferase